MKTLVLFGDSLFGRFGKDLIRSLEGKLGNDTVVLNVAAGGQNTVDCLRQSPVIAKIDPTYIVVSLGANDAAPWKQQTPLSEFRKNLNQIISNFPNAKIIFFLCPPANDLNDPQTTKVFNTLLDKYNKVLKEVCNQKDISFIDSKEVYGKLLRSGNDYHMGDGVHLDQSGYDIFIEELVNAL